MNFRLKCEKPGEIEFTLTATMTADQWEHLRETLHKAPGSYSGPAGALTGAIDDLLSQARKIYWPADSALGKNDGR